MTYEAAYSIAALLLSLMIIYIFIRRNRVSNAQSSLFLALVIDNTITASMLLARWIMTRYFNPPVWALSATSFVYFITHTALILMMYLYIQSTIRSWREIPRWGKVCVVLPISVIMLVVFLNPLLHWVYYYTPWGEYKRGAGMAAVYLVSLYYLILIIALLIIYRRLFSIKRLTAIFSAMTIGMSSVLVQMLLPEVKVESFFQTVSAFILLLFIQNPMDQTDSSLKVLSASAFTERMRSNCVGRKRFDLIEIILGNYSDFERISGMVAGRELLKEIAAYIDGLTNHANVYHVQRNIFVMELIQPRPGETTELINLIEARFLKKWETGNATIIPRILRLVLPSQIHDDKLLAGVMRRFENSSFETKVMTVEDFDLDKISRNLRITGALIRAVEEQSFELRFTPIYSMALERAVAGEVSLRFYDGQLGYVYDEEIFRFAERSGHVLELGEFMFEQTCRFIRDRELEKEGVSFLALRLYPAMCLQYNMLEKLKESMEKYGIPERMICLMVSEYTVSRSGAAFREGVEEFRKKGIRFCLEDYGSGFTSMTSIIEMPFSIIKINRTVVRSAMANEKARVTMESTLVMARELGMITGVDGINEAASFRMISDMDCDMAKGNYFFEELDPEEFIKVLHMSAEAAEKGGAE